MKYEELKKDSKINTYISKADESLKALGFTEHSFPHVCKTADTAAYILQTLDYPEHEVEIVKIAAYLHDIGNLVNRNDHPLTGAVLAFRLLDHMNVPAEDIALITTAIGNHDEKTGTPVNAVSAALILADKSDVRRTRVRNTDITSFDIHDRVNYSVKSSVLKIADDKKSITLMLEIDTEFSAVMDYFEIFLARMIMCRKAAEMLGLKFRLIINGQKLM